SGARAARCEPVVLRPDARNVSAARASGSGFSIRPARDLEMSRSAAASEPARARADHFLRRELRELGVGEAEQALEDLLVVLAERRGGSREALLRAAREAQRQRRDLERARDGVQDALGEVAL